MSIEVTPRRDTPENWEEQNPVLRYREMGLELSDGTFAMKVGDGETPWLGLPYLAIGLPLTDGLPPIVIGGSA